MRVRHSGFALIIVLLAVGAIFALAIRSAVATRTGVVEVSAVRERARSEREARAAIIIALRGLTPMGKLPDPDAMASADASTAPGGENSSVGGGGGAGAEDGTPELPEIIKALIGEPMEEVEDQAKEDALNRRNSALRITQGANVMGASPRGSIMGALRKIGLPSKPVVVEIKDREYEIELRDASGLLDVNSAPRDVLERYFGAVGVRAGVAASIADQIVDWRDDDSVPGTSGAEQPDYDRDGIVCRNGAIETLEELMFLPAMTAEVFKRVHHDLCLGGGGRVHVGSASREVLLALPGADGETVSALMALRSEGMITEKKLDEVVPQTRKALRDCLRADPSGVVTVRVRARETGTGRELATLTGVAVVSDDGVRAVGVRAE